MSNDPQAEYELRLERISRSLTALQEWVELQKLCSGVDWADVGDLGRVAVALDGVRASVGMDV